ncbi:MAG TPA: septal ring lytic transglycosylase RlpA family protein [Thermoleophilaceae bacterium]|nr:septal ring lytic transglycosylase RlpA family protein [Thermoleophilaceae bacterium]
MTTHSSVRGRGVRLYGGAAAVLMTVVFTVAQTASGQDAGVSMNVERSDSRVVFGERVHVRGRVRPKDGGRRVALQYARRGERFRTVERTRTGGRGRYLLRAKPTRSGRLRVVAQEAPPSRERRIAVVPRIASKKRFHVKSGRRAVVRGKIRPSVAGRTVRVQIRKRGSWRTVDRARTGGEGRFAAKWRMKRGAGRYKARVLFRGDRHNTGRARRARVNVYRPGGASWYGPGLYGNTTACGQTLTPRTMGVANRWLPCGTKVTFRYRGNTVTVPVIDRGPFHGSRIWDLTYATKRKLGFGDVGTVWSTR